eukprot:scaffold37906_cov20-Tisochrysis_lutea.AAC.1
MDVFRLNSKRPGMDKDSSMLSVACLCSIEFESHLHIFEKRKHACALTHAHIHTHTHTSSKLPCCHAALLLNCCDGMLAQECRPGGKTYTHTHTRTHRSAGQGGKAAEWRAKDLSVDHKPENDSERRRILMCKGRVERTRQVGHVHTRLLVYVHEFSSCAHMNVRDIVQLGVFASRRMNGAPCPLMQGGTREEGWKNLHAQSVPGGAFGVELESMQNACQNGVLGMLSPKWADQQQWLGTFSGVHYEGSRELAGIQKLPNSGGGMAGQAHKATTAPSGVAAILLGE